MPVVSIFGAGQLGSAVARQLSLNPRYDVRGPYRRTQRVAALDAGSDLVVIATTTRLADVADDVERAVTAGSNVLVSAEEAAFPFVVDRERAERIDALARDRGATVAGAGVNPGLIFDALVLTLLGAAPRGCCVEVRRTVDISGFGNVVLRRIGVGSTAEAFAAAVGRGEILGHAGFPQSMAVVADAIGVAIDRIDRVLEPVLADVDIDIPDRFVVRAGESAGVDQTYTALVGAEPWFTARFFGHVAPTSVGRTPRDDIDLLVDGAVLQSLQLVPGIGAQVGSQNMVTNSIERILAAPPGWLTVARLAPAFPAPLA